ncbi:UNVERIFIED_CONTAM: hypothetical protein BEN50_11570 [Euhalothece sp. KZN 001]
MTFLKRRHFLKFAGSAFASVALSNYYQQQGLGMARTLAQNTPRKLALLVGINRYSSATNLRGCVTDTISQRELLIHRFGFNPQDILMVSDESEIKPTRENILQAFQSHLIDQAKPGDVAMFHFSGHGSRVLDRDSLTEDGLSSTYVPQDRTRKQEGGNIFVSDITGRTLFLLMAGVNTDRLTAVLDSCHSGGGTRGNYRVRSLSSYFDSDQPFSEELEYRNQLQAQLNLPASVLQKTLARGVILAATQPEQLAVDGSFEGFYAGVFTYALTHYLWQETEPRTVTIAFEEVARRTTQISTLGQNPQFYLSGNETAVPVYFLKHPVISADGVVRQRQGNNVEMWLGGLPALSLTAFNPGAQMVSLDRNGQQIGVITLTQRDGMVGQGEICQEVELGAIKAGTFLQEKTRVIPETFRLRIGVDPSLDTTPEALAGVSNFERIIFSELGVGELEYILGRVTPKNQSEFQVANGFDTPPPIDSIGLYTPGLTPVPDSFGVSGESASASVERLTSKLRTLLAARRLKIVLNANSSRLNLSASMFTQGNQTIAQEVTVRGDNPVTETETLNQEFTDTQSNLAHVPLGTEIGLKVVSQEDRELYLTVLVTDSTGEITVVYPNTWTRDEDDNLLSPGEVRRIPNLEDRFRLIVQEPLGATEILIIASTSPMQSGLRALQSLAQSRGQTRGPQTLGTDSLEIIDNLLEDISDPSQPRLRSMLTKWQEPQAPRAKLVGVGLTSACQPIVPQGKVMETTDLAALSISFMATKS